MRTAIPVSVTTNRGALLTPNAIDVVNGNSFVNDGKTLMGIFNPDPSLTLTITMHVAPFFDGDLSVASRVYTIPPNSRMVISSIPMSYNNPDGTVSVDFSSSAAVTVISVA